MQVDNELLNRLEKLSMLKINTNKREEVIEQLSQIVNFVDNLSELDTQGVASTFAMDASATPLREDTAKCESSINDSILENAPRSEEHFFIVPKIIE